MCATWEADDGSGTGLLIFSDACLTGWGAVLNGSVARGQWTSRDASRHINELELIAALHALESFADEAVKISIRIMMDNGPSSRPDRATSYPPSERRPTSNRLAVIRSKYEARGLPDGVIKYLLATDRASTSATYQSAWNAWINWCDKRNQDSLSPSLNEILDFLCNLADQGKAYRSLNFYQSMLSATIEGFRCR